MPRVGSVVAVFACAAALLHCASTDITFPGGSGGPGPSGAGAGSSVTSTSSASETTFSGGAGGSAASGLGVGGSTTTSVTSTGSGTGGCKPILCEAKGYLCGNCADDDGDGLSDAADPDCLGPCDNTEDRLDLGIPGAGNAPCKRDCYFDKDSGAGNDDCAYDLRCDPLAPDALECPFNNPPPPNANCDGKPTTTCLDVCKPLTPNGCDCFGCCELPGGSGNFVYIGTKDANDVPTCTIANAKDPSKCAKCTPMKDCFDGCDTCELCLGKDTVPPECTPEQQCPGGTPCDPKAVNPCPGGEYCLTGCCAAPNPT
jgi:hypothetical protein